MKSKILLDGKALKVSTYIQEGKIKIKQEYVEFREGDVLAGIEEISEAQHKDYVNIKMKDSSVLTNVPSSLIKNKPKEKKKGGCGGCAKKRKK
jgi:ribulose bisphosphate carboxylase small subunit